jgi:aspartyl-tRNA(Asn)/glutamyl-tRNA(Gln) amidotransferase subunit A
MLRLTQLFNVTGHPAISIPCGATTDGLPVGLQFVGRRSRTSDLLSTALVIERLL